MEFCEKNPLENRKINGIFTSPPYVGQIDYHDQHIYAYELFNFPRNDNLEIGPQQAGKSKQAQNNYVEGIASVFQNAKKYLNNNAKIFIVANDKLNLYPEIARRSGIIKFFLHQIHNCSYANVFKHIKI